MKYLFLTALLLLASFGAYADTTVNLSNNTTVTPHQLKFSPASRFMTIDAETVGLSSAITEWSPVMSVNGAGKCESENGRLYLTTIKPLGTGQFSNYCFVGGNPNLTLSVKADKAACDFTGSYNCEVDLTFSGVEFK